MTPDSAIAWSDANQQYLSAVLAGLRARLERRLEARAWTADVAEPVVEAVRSPEGMQPPPALEILSGLFQLTSFERDLLLLCAGVELDSRFGPLLAALNEDPERAAPTFSLALACLPEAHWNALTPAAPLRRWRLLELGSGPTLTLRPLRIDERILHFLTGITHLDERLTGYIAAVPGGGSELVPSQRQVADLIVAAWSKSAWQAQPPVIQLFGGDPAAHQAIAAAVGARLNLKLHRLPVAVLPASPVEMDSLLRLWEREALLSGNVLLLDCEQPEAGETGREALASRWIDDLNTPLILSSRERLHVRRPLVTFEVSKPTQSEQRELWQAALGPAAAHLNGRMDALLAHFNLDAASIQSISAETLQAEPASPEALAEALWTACNEHSRPNLSELAQFIRPMAGWDDLVLPPAHMQTLHEVSMHVRQRMKVYETWGFAARSTRGLGITALFSGVSGTGKTMAAEVLAKDLKLELFRIDLSQVISKYIGETEKNLRRVFDVAEEGGSILLFDEADALFGKRSEVKDSHDRYANVEVSYLLQRMESYRGLAILTTNLKENLDQAFMRRIRFVVHFPFPDAGQRAEIWRRIFPAQTPTEGLDIGRLARLNIPGGNIRNIALYSAFLAADAGEPVRMHHLLRAAQVEYAKLERPLNEAGLGGSL
jgi:hypothetical protein